jgi:hypothetical protein
MKMHEENLLTIQQYALKHKLSTFAVIKQVTSGKLKTIKQDDQELILDTSAPMAAKTTETTSQSHTQPEEKTVDYEAKFHELLSKYIDLQEKYTRLIEEKYDAKK